MKRLFPSVPHPPSDLHGGSLNTASIDMVTHLNVLHLPRTVEVLVKMSHTTFPSSADGVPPHPHAELSQYWMHLTSKSTIFHLNHQLSLKMMVRLSGPRRTGMGSVVIVFLNRQRRSIGNQFGTGSYMYFLQSGIRMHPIALPRSTSRMKMSDSTVNDPAEQK